MFGFSRRRKPWPIGAPCANCQAEAKHGYSERPEEEIENLKPLCPKCLDRQLHIDYASFAGKAIVVAPVSGPPVYVFHVAAEWKNHFTDSEIADDVTALLGGMDTTCADCRHNANFLWVNADGLTGENFGEVLDRGVTATLLQNNPRPRSLCARCCVGRICKALDIEKISYLEICSPKGEAAGFVLPMGY